MPEAVIFDLEWTAWPGSVDRKWSGPNEHREIVQIGAIRVDGRTVEERAAFDVLVLPRINPVLSDYFVTLTGISNDVLRQAGTDFADALNAFLAFIGERPLFCYGRDHLVVRENITLCGLENAVSFPDAFNMAVWFADNGLDTRHLNSGHLAEHLGLPVPETGQEHNALYDCRSIALAANHLIKSGARSRFLSRS